MRRDGRELAPIAAADPAAWQRIWIYRDWMMAQRTDGGFRAYHLDGVEPGGRLRLKPTYPRDELRELTAVTEGGRLRTLTGHIGGEETTLKLAALPRDPFRLLNRRFRWISEAPDNR